jgi:hypothetical protein
VVKEYILYAEDVENMHIISKKEYVLLVVLENLLKSENTTGRELKTKIKIILNYIIFFDINIIIYSIIKT